MPTVVAAEGAILERILDTTYPVLHQDLSRQAFAKFDAAQRKTAWALGHQRRFALVEGADLLASAQRYELSGTIDRQCVSICGIGAVCTDPACHDGCHARVLVERLIDDARRDGADLALLFIATDRTRYAPESFEVIPTGDVELKVAESSRYGAPMTLVRSGEDRDLAAIAAMGQARASQFRFHLDRDVDLVKYVITKKRLLAGLGSAGVRQLQFVIAEEGITAAAYMVVSIVTARGRLKNAATVTPLAHVSAPSFKHSSRANQWNNGRSSAGGCRLASCLPRSRSYRRGLRQR
jgi:hypothetical protein